MWGNSVGSAVFPFMIVCGGSYGLANAEYFEHAACTFAPRLLDALSVHL